MLTRKQRSRIAIGTILAIVIVAYAGWIFQNQWLKIAALLAAVIGIFSVLSIFGPYGEIHPERFRQALITILAFGAIGGILLFLQNSF